MLNKNPDKNSLCVMHQNCFIGYCKRFNFTQAYRDACFIHHNLAYWSYDVSFNIRYDTDNFDSK